MRTAVAILCLAIAAFSCRRKAEQENIVDRIELNDLNENPIDLDQYQNKVMLLNFWATWCAPCIEEMPSLQKLSTLLPADSIVFVLASNESAKRIAAFQAGQTSTFQFVQLENMEELGVQVLPTTYVIDRKGEVVFSEVGKQQWDSPEYVERLKRIIHGNP